VTFIEEPSGIRMYAGGKPVEASVPAPEADNPE
jgi:hypothetical protein